MSYSEMPLVAHPLSDVEKARLLACLEPLLHYLGAPGDWGYETKLGRMTISLIELRNEIVRSQSRSAA